MNDKLLGDPNNKLWIISTCPRKGDKGGPLSTLTGQQFIQYMLLAGGSREEVHFDYLVNQTPSKGGIESFPDQVRERGIAELKEKIKQYKPNLVLCLGAEPLKYLIGGKLGILKWRGHVIWNEEMQTKLLCTFEPYHAWKQTQISKKEQQRGQIPGQYVFLMRNDIGKAIDESKIAGTHFAEPKYIVKPSYAQVIQELDRIEKVGKVLSFDIEIMAPYTGHLMDCISLACDLETAISIPFYIPNGEGKIIRYWKNEHEHIEIMQRIKRLLESPIPKVAQNAQFDITILAAYYDIHVNNLVWDTMVVAHELYCDLPKDLGTLISLYTDLPQHKYMIQSDSVMDRWEYSAADASANLHVRAGQQAEMEDIEEKHWKNTEYYQHYMAITNPSIMTCIRMHMDGTRVDNELREFVIKRETSIMELVEELINEIMPVSFEQKKDVKFNFNSAKQKNFLFYEVLGEKVRYLNGQPTTDANTMKEIMEDGGPYAKLLAELCLTYRMADAALGKFKIDPDGEYIRSKYDVCGTDTGRLASGENKDEDVAMKMKPNPILPAETNMQNIKKGPARKMFLPRRGEEFALVDLYSAEAYLTALDAGELELLEILDKGEKPYNIVLDETRKMFPAECKHVGYDYKKAKQTVHACNYGVAPWKMSKESLLPLRICEWQYNWYHNKYPGIKERMNRIKSQVDSTRWLRSPLGRKRYFVIPPGHERDNKAFAWPSQSAIGEIAKIAMNKLYAISIRHEIGDTSVPWCMPNINTHDGLAVRVKENTRDEVTSAIRLAFKVPMTLRGITIHIPVEIGWGKNFNDMREEEVYFYEANSH